MNIQMPSPAVFTSRDFSERSFESEDDPTMCAASDSSSAGGSVSDEEQAEPMSATQPQTRPVSVGFAGSFRKLHERSDSGQIRSKLLLKLGIEKGYAGITGGMNTEASRVVQQGQEDAFSVTLKGDYGRPDQLLELSKESIDSLATSPGDHGILEKHTKRGNVCFDASVKVHPIPARSDYSKRMRSVMWVSSTEIQQNAARNSLEFAAEDWDVSKVVDDKDMVMYGGERIHPIHFVQMDAMNHDLNNRAPKE
jgi:hypothetical protein